MCNLYEYELQEWEIAHLIEHYKLLGMNWTEAMKVYPNRPGAVVVDRAGERVVVDMLWGLTPWGRGTWLTNFRNPHLKTWKPLIDRKAQRCVVPATRFAEPDRTPASLCSAAGSRAPTASPSCSRASGPNGPAIGEPGRCPTSASTCSTRS
jgi:putative SOS response-associated peptidase YedK